MISNNQERSLSFWKQLHLSRKNGQNFFAKHFICEYLLKSSFNQELFRVSHVRSSINFSENAVFENAYCGQKYFETFLLKEFILLNNVEGAPGKKYSVSGKILVTELIFFECGLFNYHTEMRASNLSFMLILHRLIQSPNG